MRIGVVLLSGLAATGCQRVLGLDPVTSADAGHVARADARPTDARPGDAPGPDGAMVDPCAVPFAYYTFDTTTLTDSSGNGYEGMLGAPPTLVPGVQGSAYQFAGTSSAEITYPTAFQRSPLTISLWFRPDSVADGNCFINQLFDTGNNTYDDSWQLCLTSDAVAAYGGGLGLSAGQLATGTWYHVALVLDGTSAKLWLDGASSAMSFTPSYDHQSGIVLGADIDQSITLSAAYQGALDELKFFACALSDQQLATQ